MLDTTLTHTIANDGGLRVRLEACVRRRLATHDVSRTERMLLTLVPVEPLAWAVAANPAIFGQIKTALDDGTDVTAAVAEGLTDSDLEFVVFAELTCLQA